MAKKKSKKGTAAHTSDSAKPAGLVVPSVVRLSPLTPIQPLRELEDRRQWNPTRTIARPQSIRRSDARVTLRSPRAKILQTKTPLGFNVPDRVALCVRRETRREVLHAKRIAGKSGLKKPKRNFWSSISCKR